MKYFAYGSNMSLARLQARTPVAVCRGVFVLEQHDLRFHKASHDGSAKCDAYFTGREADRIYGALFDIDPEEKPILDGVEGLGAGYEIKPVQVAGTDGESLEAFTYYATDLDAGLKPYTWYLNHVLVGARELELPPTYIQQLEAVEALPDPNPVRAKLEWAVHDKPRSD